jgi:hypothetical protein
MNFMLKDLWICDVVYVRRLIVEPLRQMLNMC